MILDPSLLSIVVTLNLQMRELYRSAFATIETCGNNLFQG